MAIAAKHIVSEQLRLLFAAQRLTLTGSIINAIILATVLWPVENHAQVLVWLGLFLGISAGRGLLVYLYNRNQPLGEDRQQNYLRGFLLLTLLAGLAWGAVSLWLFPRDSVLHQAFIAFVMAGNCAAAIISLSYIMEAALALVLPSLLPLIGQFFLVQTKLSIAMGIMVSMFLLIALSGIRRNFENNRQNITLRMESIEHEKTILASQQKLTLHVQQTPLAVIELSTGFRVTDWNPAAEKIFGYKKEEVLGKHAADLIVPDDAKPAVANICSALLAKKGGMQSTNDNITKDGRRITCEWYNTPLINNQGKVIGIASLAHDITERTQMEQIKNDFISTVSHELRTPLTSIRGAMRLLTASNIEWDSHDYHHLMDIASNNTDRLLLIINDILDIHKIESGKMEFDFEPLALSPFLEQAVEANQTFANQYRVTYQLQPAYEKLLVRADPNRLMQVMYNLLSNAAKFSRPGQVVEIGAQKRCGMARITVSDHGAGIDHDFAQHVFERFSRGDSSNTQQAGGTGLGLSIVKSIVEQHGGAISFKSKPGQGTRFDVDLPLI